MHVTVQLLATPIQTCDIICTEGMGRDNTGTLMLSHMSASAQIPKTVMCHPSLGPPERTSTQGRLWIVELALQRHA